MGNVDAERATGPGRQTMTERAPCHVCGDPGDTGICPTCRAEQEFQAREAARGWRAYLDGRPVVWAWGRPFLDPAAAED